MRVFGPSRFRLTWERGVVWRAVGAAVALLLVLFFVLRFARILLRLLLLSLVCIAVVRVVQAFRRHRPALQQQGRVLVEKGQVLAGQTADLCLRTAPKVKEACKEGAEVTAEAAAKLAAAGRQAWVKTRPHRYTAWQVVRESVCGGAVGAALGGVCFLQDAAAVAAIPIGVLGGLLLGATVGLTRQPSLTVEDAAE